MATAAVQHARDLEGAAGHRRLAEQAEPQAWARTWALCRSPLQRHHAQDRGDTDVFFAARSYRSFTADVWADCAAPIRVSHVRLDRVIAGWGGYRSDFLTPEDIARVEAGLRAGLGL